MGYEYDHDGKRYALVFSYALPCDAWHIELTESVPAPARWADQPTAPTAVPGLPILVAEVPDEDLSRDPAVLLDPVVTPDTRPARRIPYAVLRWFLDVVAEEIERCRAGDDASRG